MMFAELLVNIIAVMLFIYPILLAYSAPSHRFKVIDLISLSIAAKILMQTQHTALKSFIAALFFVFAVELYLGNHFLQNWVDIIVIGVVSMTIWTGLDIIPSQKVDTRRA